MYTNKMKENKKIISESQENQRFTSILGSHVLQEFSNFALGPSSQKIRCMVTKTTQICLVEGYMPTENFGL